MQQHAEAGCSTNTDPATSNPAAADQLFVMASDAQAFRSLAAIAPGLSPAELKIALHLAAIRNPHTNTAKAGTADLIRDTHLSRRAIQYAIDSLTRRCLIATGEGGGAKKGRYLLNFLAVTAIPTGAKFAPPAQQTLALQPPEPAQILRPLSDQTTPLDIDVVPNSILDRVFAAKPQHFQRAELDHVKGFAYKWLLLQQGMQGAQPPDDLLCAHLIVAAGGAHHAADFIRDNLRDRGAENCAYLRSMMLQRLHQIAPSTVKRKLAIAARNGKRTDPPPIGEQPTPDASADLVRQAIAGVKNLR